LQFKVFRLLLKHIRKSSLFIIGELSAESVQVYVGAIVSPFLEFPVLEESLLFFQEVFFTFDEPVFKIVALFQNFAEGVVFQQMVFHVAAQETFEQLTLLRYEISRASYHL
jgi:hypothetical protein